MLEFLSERTTVELWLIFLAENLAVTAIALLSGWLMLKFGNKNIKPASSTEWLICAATNIINTVVTYTGFSFWQSGYITFNFKPDWTIVTDFAILFLVMDLAMYVFHFAIHKISFVYKTVHRFHHKYDNPIPIDLFVLHPFETVCFGALWLIIIMLTAFNFYAVVIYLTANVIFGVAGHLGFEPLPAAIRDNKFLKYAGTSTFHHRHHLDIHHNFGFYTTIWDRIFGTYKP